MALSTDYADSVRNFFRFRGERSSSDHDLIGAFGAHAVLRLARDRGAGPWIGKHLVT